MNYSSMDVFYVFIYIYIETWWIYINEKFEEKAGILEYYYRRRPTYEKEREKISKKKREKKRGSLCKLVLVCSLCDTRESIEGKKKKK